MHGTTVSRIVLGAFILAASVGHSQPTPTPNSDINLDGRVDHADLLILSGDWNPQGENGSQESPTPTPTHVPPDLVVNLPAGCFAFQFQCKDQEKGRIPPVWRAFQRLKGAKAR